jgi:hypothetical protein
MINIGNGPRSMDEWVDRFDWQQNNGLIANVNERMPQLIELTKKRVHWGGSNRAERWRGEAEFDRTEQNDGSGKSNRSDGAERWIGQRSNRSERGE